MLSFKNILSNIFLYKEPIKRSEFYLPQNKEITNTLETVNKSVNKSLELNLDYIKLAYNTKINSDIKLRKFKLNIYGNTYSSLLLFIDGMIDSESINNFILKPIMAKNYNMKSKVSSITSNNVTIKKIKKINLEEYISDVLVPQNTMKKETDFKEIFKSVNMGDCALFIDTLSTSFVIDVKGFETRNITQPQNEIVVRGSQEAFVEKLRTNTSILRRLVNNENLIIENTNVGNISKTNVAICYMKNITNSDLVKEVKNRINNLDIDSIFSSGQLEQLIEDDNSLFPEIIASERPDKAVNHLLEGRVVVIVNGSPYCLIMPGVFIDFMSSPEDVNLKYHYSNLLKFVRIIAFVITLFLPGFYVAISNYHTELLPTELLFTIAAARNTVPFPVIFEILLMEFSFELIREAGLRVPSPIGPTIRNSWCINTSGKQQLLQT